MAKTFQMEDFEDAVISDVYVVVNGVKYPLIVEYEKESTTPVNSDKLNKIKNTLETLCNEGATSKDIVIGLESNTTDDTKLFFDENEFDENGLEIGSKGSEVVDSLEGNESYKAPSVRAIKKALSICDYGQTENTLVQVNGYVDVNITFSKVFTKSPMVVLSIEMDSTNVDYTKVTCIVNSRTKTGATIRIFNSSSATKQPRINWIAIGE